MFLTSDVAWDERVDIVVSSFYRGTCARGTFFTRSLKPRYLQFLDLRVPRRFRESYAKLLAVQTLGVESLVIHVRSGDIMTSAGSHAAYAQPPCSYYGRILQDANWSQIYVFSEDMANPCLMSLRSIGHLNVGGSLNKDLSRMLGARNLAIGRGTMGFMMAIMSLSLERIYTFNASTSRFLVETDISIHKNCVPSRSYYVQVVRHWKCTKGQLSQMKTGQCDLEAVNASQASRYVAETLI